MEINVSGSFDTTNPNDENDSYVTVHVRGTDCPSDEVARVYANTIRKLKEEMDADNGQKSS